MAGERQGVIRSRDKGKTRTGGGQTEVRSGSGTIKESRKQKPCEGISQFRKKKLVIDGKRFSSSNTEEGLDHPRNVLYFRKYELLEDAQRNADVSSTEIKLDSPKKSIKMEIIGRF
ncbi:hypothetical protein KM043_011642 [Ampulex compressa]|nr:hypothetical protein KM043_011642 [Ampulex compressa]